MHKKRLINFFMGYFVGGYWKAKRAKKINHFFCYIFEKEVIIIFLIKFANFKNNIFFLIDISHEAPITSKIIHFLLIDISHEAPLT